MQKRNIYSDITFILYFILGSVTVYAQPHMENLNRGVVVVRTSNKQVFIGWWLLGSMLKALLRAKSLFGFRIYYYFIAYLRPIGS